MNRQLWLSPQEGQHGNDTPVVLRVPASPIVLATIPMNARVPRATRLSMRDFHLTFTVAARGPQAGRVSWNARNTLTSKEDRVTDNALVTCLWFDTEGEAAAALYTSIFKDSKLGRVSRYTEAGPRQAGTVMEVEFELNGQKFVALNGGPEFSFTISFAYRSDRPQEKAMVTARQQALARAGIQQQQALARAGIQVSLQSYPSGRYYEQNDPVVNNLFEKAMASLR